ncbi:MAG: extracellular solute-binding protein [Phycisphaerae bacterium]|nr:extracellular solute-binding protein [Phycisphaerae bacterium]
MHAGRITLFLLLAVLIGVPIALAPRDDTATARSAANTLVIFTPHNENIRQEFGRAFEAWHQRNYGETAYVAWSTPGGTSEIRKMLDAAYRADLVRHAETGEAIGGMADLLFGGGSYEFMKLAKPIVVTTPSGQQSTTVLVPVTFSEEFLHDVYGDESHIGDIPMFAPDGMWFGAALSGFGIVYNRDVLRERGVDDPTRWDDLCDPKLVGWIALVNPAQSGSVATAYEAILQRRGWVEGWRILRRMAANARTFSASAPKAPTDVSLGEAAAGVCIDFYGRYQSQVIIDAGRHAGSQDPQTARVGYIDPKAETVIDPDPIAVLRGAPHPELAQRFVEFVLSREGQALWQFRPRDHEIDGLGPTQYELRRMPVRRSMYKSDDLARFVDQVDPWTIATAVEAPNDAFRAFFPGLFVAMAIENRAHLRDAWLAIIRHPAYPGTRGIVTHEDVTDPQLKEMLRTFDAMPTVQGPDGVEFHLGDPDQLAAVRAGWLEGKWHAAGLWPDDAAPAEVLRGHMTAFFRTQYRHVTAQAQQGSPKGDA